MENILMLKYGKDGKETQTYAHKTYIYGKRPIHTGKRPILKTWVPHECIRADISICMLCSETCTYGKYTYVNVWKRWKRNLNICTKDLHIWKETYTYGKETNVYQY